ncbi:MAG TPA: hypothetical protein DDY91_19345 [Planctomycetaceae bacterium]|nr:hypothetical protein [Planctomycetaceae bacterium]
MSAPVRTATVRANRLIFAFEMGEPGPKLAPFDRTTPAVGRGRTEGRSNSRSLREKSGAGN